MRVYAEVYRGFVVDNNVRRDDDRVPEFSGRIAVRIDDLPTRPSIGDEHLGGTNFSAPTRPNPNLDPPPKQEAEILEEIRGIVRRILRVVDPPGP